MICHPSVRPFDYVDPTPRPEKPSMIGASARASAHPPASVDLPAATAPLRRRSGAPDLADTSARQRRQPPQEPRTCTSRRVQQAAARQTSLALPACRRRNLRREDTSTSHHLRRQRRFSLRKRSVDSVPPVLQHLRTTDASSSRLGNAQTPSNEISTPSTPNSRTRGSKFASHSPARSAADLLRYRFHPQQLGSALPLLHRPRIWD